MRKQIFALLSIIVCLMSIGNAQQAEVDTTQISDKDLNDNGWTKKDGKLVAAHGTIDGPAKVSLKDNKLTVEGGNVHYTATPPQGNALKIEGANFKLTTPKGTHEATGSFLVNSDGSQLKLEGGSVELRQDGIKEKVFLNQLASAMIDSEGRVAYKGPIKAVECLSADCSQTGREKHALAIAGGILVRSDSFACESGVSCLFEDNKKYIFRMGKDAPSLDGLIPNLDQLQIPDADLGLDIKGAGRNLHLRLIPDAGTLDLHGFGPNSGNAIPGMNENGEIIFKVPTPEELEEFQRMIPGGKRTQLWQNDFAVVQDNGGFRVAGVFPSFSEIVTKSMVIQELGPKIFAVFTPAGQKLGEYLMVPSYSSTIDAIMQRFGSS